MCPQTFDPSFLAVRCFPYVPGNGTYVTQQLGPQLGLGYVASLALVRGSVILLLECSTVFVLHRVAGRSARQSHAQLEAAENGPTRLPLQIQAVCIAVPIYILLIL